MSAPAAEAPSAELASGTGSKLFQSMPVLGLLLAFDTRWRLFRDSHRRNEGVAELHELFRDLSTEIHRLGLVEQFTGRFSFDGDAGEAFARCLELARGAGLQWPEIVEIVNRSGEAGK